MILKGKETNFDDFVVYLKVLACFLITNSHCKDLYPLAFFAAGGSWGNAIFFLLSGYCLANIKSDFKSWYLRRIKRLLPPLVAVIFISIFLTDGLEFFFSHSISTLFVYYINKYWFVFAILILYILYYFSMRIIDSKNEGLAIGILVLVYMGAYILCVDKSVYSIEPSGIDFFKCFSYFIIFMIGGFIRRNSSTVIHNISERPRWIFLLISIISLVTWIVLYYIIVVRGLFFDMQFLIHISLWIWVVSVCYVAQKYEKEIERLIPTNNNLLNLIAESTLEIYLVQITFKKYIMTFSFPSNAIIFWIMALAGGVLLRKVMCLKKLK